MYNPDKIFSPETNVKIDGNAIRCLREEQGLTQLYVAKVVGVTSDTISRWENNRYPSIKTTNAKRLAEALEVDVEFILQQLPEDEVEAVPETGGQKKARLSRLRLIVVGVALVAVGLSLLWKLLPPLGQDIRAERLLPSYAAPGAVLPVKLTFSGSAARIVVREQIPPGWELLKAVPKPDSFDPSSGLMRWILEVGEQDIAIYYIVKVFAHAPLHSLQKFNGELVLRSEMTRHGRSSMLGANQLVIEMVHWADLNADNRIDDDEMLDAYYLAEYANLSSQGVEVLEKLWMAEHYYWDSETTHFVGVKSPASISD